MQAGKFWYRKCILTETANVGNVNLKWEMRVDFVHNVQDNVDVPKQCLYKHFFEPGTQPVQKQGKYKRDRKREQQHCKAQCKRIPKHLPKVIGVKKCNKVFQSHPGASPDPLSGGKILKRDLYSCYGPVSEYDHLYHSG